MVGTLFEGEAALELTVGKLAHQGGYSPFAPTSHLSEAPLPARRPAVTRVGMMTSLVCTLSLTQLWADGECRGRVIAIWASIHGCRVEGVCLSRWLVGGLAWSVDKRVDDVARAAVERRNRS
jgi:hypothetical protein